MQFLLASRVTCSFYKLAHETNYFQCNKLFAIVKSSSNMVLHEFVVVNVVFKNQNWCPQCEDLLRVMSRASRIVQPPSCSQCN